MTSHKFRVGHSFSFTFGLLHLRRVYEIELYSLKLVGGY